MKKYLGATMATKEFEAPLQQGLSVVTVQDVMDY